MKNRAIIYIFFIVFFGLCSCSSVKTYKKPEFETKDLFRDITPSDTNTLGNVSWKEMFNDPKLQSLIAEGLANNIDLKIAIARIKQADASLAQSKAAFYPTLTASANTGVTQRIDSSFSKMSQLALNSSWEIDLWGKLSSAEEANLALLLQSQAYLRVVKTQLISDIANAYFLLLAQDAQLKIAQKTLEIRVQNVNVMKDLKEASMVNEAAVVQNEAAKYAVEVTIPDIKQSIRVTENTISLLLGRPSGSISRSDIESQIFPDKLQTGVPAQLLSNRPDLRQSENAFRYAFELTNVARSYFYPSFTITASANLTETDFKDIFRPGSLVGNLVGGLIYPIFNQGANDARLNTAEAKLEEALLNYKKTMLIAGQEVSNSMFLYQTALEKANVRTNQIESLSKSVEITKELLRFSSSNYIDVLTAEQNLLTAQLSRINDKLQQFQSIISLYKALGGGWK